MRINGILSGIYRILNIENGKCYIGSAVNYNKRISQHKNTLKKSKHYNAKLQRAWNKYGIDAFCFELIEPVADVEMLLKREQYWIEFYDCANSGYNINPIAGSCLGRPVTSETKQKIKEKRAKQPPMSEDGRLRIVAALCARPPVSEETRRKLSLANKGRKATPEQIEKNRRKQIGIKLSSETIAKRSAARTGFKHSEESKAKMSAWQIGRKMQPESVAKAVANRVLTDAGRKKLAAAGRSMKGKQKPNGMADKLREHQIKTGWRPSEKMIEASRKANTGRKFSADVIARRVATRAKNKALNAPAGHAFQA